MIRNNKLKTISQNLRNNQTKEERRLWYCFLRDLPVQFHRQYVIGNYIVDFCCPTKKIIIELDGSQHYETLHENKDKIRDNDLNELGYIVLRYSNYLLHKKFKSVCEDIYSHLGLD
ncbi:MAG: endonuclease domain-containing protein [Candidatus Coproplasma sp.]